MQYKTFLLALALAGSLSSVAASARTPRDIATYVKNATTCEHLAGEWDSSLEESEQLRIQRDVIRYCGAAKKQLPVLKKKYRRNARMTKILDDHSYESVASFVK